jgi:putative transposase
MHSSAKHPRALNDTERQAVLDALHSKRFADQAPAAVYAKLLDEGTYHCSVSTMYRILHENQEVRERRNQLRHPAYRKPQLLATAPNQVWSWDITKLLGPAKWTYYYLYVIMDIYSRYAVGWMVASRENADLAQRLIRDSIQRQQVDANQLTLHSDRGPAMKSHSVAQLLATLGVTKSHSRPHVSNDNPFSESQFKTLKYRPEFPTRFGCQEDARAFCQRFFRWYNHEHYHSGIGLLTPYAVHYGHAQQIVGRRQQTLDGAYQAHPERFVNKRPTPPSLPEAVWINPPKTSDDQHQKRLPETSGSQKPNAPLAHCRLGYPSSGCSSAVPDSVLPSKLHTNSAVHQIQCPLDTGGHASQNLGGLGAEPPSNKHCSRSEAKIH